MPLPRIEPTKLSRRLSPFDHPDWLFELKHDGFRAMAYIADGRCDLISRRNWRYKLFMPLCTALAGLRVREAILDGEIVCLDAMGRSVFKELLYRRGSPVFYAFDLVWLNGRDLREVPLSGRKQRLRKIVTPGVPILYADHVERNGVELFAATCALDLEGIIAKRKDGTYRHGGWVKIKNPAYTQTEGRHELFDGFKVRGRRARGSRTE